MVKKEFRDMSLTVGAGGYTVPDGFVNSLEQALLTFGGVRQVADVMRTEIMELLERGEDFEKIANLASSASVYLHYLNDGGQIFPGYGTERTNLKRMSKIPGLGYPDGSNDP